MAIPDNNTSDESTVEHIIFEGGDVGTTVEHFKVTGGKHTWPGTTLLQDLELIRISMLLMRFGNSFQGMILMV